MKRATKLRMSQMATAGVARAASVCPNAYPWSVAVEFHGIGGFDHKHLTTRRPKEASR